MGKKKKEQDGKSVSFDAFFSSTPIKSSGGSSSQVKDAHAEKKNVQAKVLNIEPPKTSLDESIDHLDDAGLIPAPPISPSREMESNERVWEDPDTITVMEEEPVIPDITWQFDETKKKQRVLHDGVVYYCRACRNHFKGPVIINNAINLNAFYNIKSCPLCGECQVNDTHNTTLDKQGTCEVCGCTLGIGYNMKLTEKQVCLNCDRDLLEKLIKGKV